MNFDFAQRSALLLIRFYQKAISPLMRPSCRFFPTCSGYAHEAFSRFGFVDGMFLTLARLLKCHPFHEGGFDPVPSPCKKEECSSQKR